MYSVILCYYCYSVVIVVVFILYFCFVPITYMYCSTDVLYRKVCALCVTVFMLLKISNIIKSKKNNLWIIHTLIRKIFILSQKNFKRFDKEGFRVHSLTLKKYLLWPKRALGTFIHYLTSVRKDSIIQKCISMKGICFEEKNSVECFFDQKEL